MQDENSLLNIAFIQEDNESITSIIDDERSFTKYSKCYFFHNLNKSSAEKVLSDLVKGSWILWNYEEKNQKKNAITIKLEEGYVHHYNFIFDIFNEEYEVYIEQENQKTYVEKKYKTFLDFLKKLNEIYGLEIDKQVIYEND